MLEELDDLPWGTFDVVTSWDVLEHTPTPRQFAERLARLLAPDGTLAVTTLNVASLAWWCFGMRWSMVCEDHFTYWNRRSPLSLFATLGLAVRDVEIFGLGRDFVSVLDRWRGRSAPAPAPVASSDDEGGGWDVRPSVLRVEEVVNRLVNAYGGGVGIGVILTRSSVDGTAAS